MRRLLFLLTFLAMLQGAPLQASEGNEQRVQSLFLQVRCVTCQSQSIADSGAPLAQDMRSLIREQVASGQSDDAILNLLQSRYGDAVLMKPPFALHTAILWLTPLLVVGIGLFIAIRSRKAPAT
jgi:cytochrome c-type biogenesis protein CcmH